MQADRLPRGAPVTVTQVPTLPDSAQPWHWPPQAAEQQTLSTQNPVVHSVMLWHGKPFALVGTQTPLASQYLPLPHDDPLQADEHFVVSAQSPLGQAIVVAVVQAPPPLHAVADVADPAEQVAAVQATLLPGKVQAVPFEPLQLPAHGAVPPQAPRLPRGVPVTLTQVPGLAVSLQPWHFPPQALLQQTPSTHWPLVHSVVVWQLVPFAFFGAQAPLAVQ
jgi:hypothetical protein